MQHQPGTLIEGKYEILGKLGEGGMGAIYKVRHRLLDEIRVVKVMRSQVAVDEELKRRFLEEARTATRLKHANIGTIHDFALDDDGTAYLVMEFIEGVNLRELLVLRGRPAVGLALEIAHQALLALGYLHRGNVVHRDIAPDNLMLSQGEDGSALIKVIDLGIAKTLDNPVAVTSTGVFLGKLKYASPEQYGSLPPSQRLDGRSDLYSLGVVLYELLTGTRPFRGDTAAELLRAHLFEPPLPFSETDPEATVPPELRAVVLKALEKNREDRFQSAEEFDREIQALRPGFVVPDLERTVAPLPGFPPNSGTQAGTVTPSAQDRLDVRFGARLATPFPTGSTSSSSPPPAPATTVRGVGHDDSPKVIPAPARLDRRAGIAIAGALAAIAALVLLRTRAPARVHPSPTPPAATPAAASSVAPDALPQARESPSPPEPTAPPSPVPISEDRVAPAPEESPRLGRQADAARVRSGRARQGAERARAPELAAGLYGFGQSQEREGQRLMAQRNYAAAGAAFDAAAGAFNQAESASLKMSEARPSPVEQVATLPEPSLRPRPTAPAVSVPTSPLEAAGRPSSPPTETARAAPTDQERIRQVLRDYEHAQNTLDLNLLERVYPALTGQARRDIENAWQGLKSQQLALEIQQIELKNSHATVRAHQRLVAVPRVGGEQADERERLFTLEKRGDSWVIVGLS